MTADLIFVSYSHVDVERVDWLKRLKLYLAPLTKDKPLRDWDDRQISSGDLWQQKITSALSEAAAAILLVGPGFFASKFIEETEWPELKRAVETRGLRLYPLIIGHSSYPVSFLKDYQAFNDPQLPLEGLPEPEQNKWLNKISMAVCLDMLQKVQQSSSQPVDTPTKSETWQSARGDEYTRTDGYMLVHTYRPSKQQGQAFDIFLFLMRHRRGAKGPPVRVFEEIETAEFFFGDSWGNRVFTVPNEGGLIGIRTSAWGTFLATCRLIFKDKNRQPVILHRYIDFEMAT